MAKAKSGTFNVMTHHEDLYPLPESFNLKAVQLLAKEARKIISPDPNNPIDKRCGAQAAWDLAGWGISMLPDDHNPPIIYRSMAMEVSQDEVDTLDELGRSKGPFDKVDWKRVFDIALKLLSIFVG